MSILNSLVVFIMLLWYAGYVTGVCFLGDLIMSIILVLPTMKLLKNKIHCSSILGFQLTSLAVRVLCLSGDTLGMGSIPTIASYILISFYVTLVCSISLWKHLDTAKDWNEVRRSDITASYIKCMSLTCISAIIGMAITFIDFKLVNFVDNLLYCIGILTIVNIASLVNYEFNKKARVKELYEQFKKTHPYDEDIEVEDLREE